MLSVKILPHFAFSNPKIITTERQFADVSTPQAFTGKCLSLKMGYIGNQPRRRHSNKAIEAVLSGLLRNRNVTSLDFAELNDIEAPSSSLSEGFTITASPIGETNELKITVEVSGKKTQEIYDEVFSKMVDDAQPIPGFRRVKGGKTPNIPKHILLEILGPSKVYEQVLKKVINSAIADYVAKEGLAVGNDLQIEQSFEDLEAAFEPGVNFRFDAIVQCQDIN